MIAPRARIVRLTHGAMAVGVLIFSAVSYFVMRPAMSRSQNFPSSIANVVLAAALAICGLSFVMRKRVPTRSTDESADSYWVRAASPAMLVWSILEGAGLISIVMYGLSGSPLALGVAAFAILLLLLANPASFEKQ